MPKTQPQKIEDWEKDKLKIGKIIITKGKFKPPHWIIRAEFIGRNKPPFGVNIGGNKTKRQAIKNLIEYFCQEEREKLIIEQRRKYTELIHKARQSEKEKLLEEIIKILEEVIEEEYGEGKGVTTRIIVALKNKKLLNP